MMSAIPDIEII